MVSWGSKATVVQEAWGVLAVNQQISCQTRGPNNKILWCSLQGMMLEIKQSWVYHTRASQPYIYTMSSWIEALKEVLTGTRKWASEQQQPAKGEGLLSQAGKKVSFALLIQLPSWPPMLEEMSIGEKGRTDPAPMLSTLLAPCLQN
jgi:hypothetical protein